MGGLRKEKRPRKKEEMVVKKVNIFTSKELRTLLGVDIDGAGTDRSPVEADISAANTAADRVKGIRKRGGEKKKKGVAKKNVYWRENQNEERVIICDEEEEGVGNSEVGK